MRNPFKRTKDDVTQAEELGKLKSLIDGWFQDYQPIHDEMTRYLKRYTGKWYSDNLEQGDSKIFANMLFATVQTVAPLLTDNQPIWAARARQPYMQNYMAAHSLALEYLWDKLELGMKLFKWVLDALLMKMGIAKVRFDPDTDEVAVDVVDPRNYFQAPGYEDNWDVPLCGTRERKPLSWIRMAFPEKGAEVKPDDDPKFDDGSVLDFELHTKYAAVYEVWFKDASMERYFVDEEGEETQDKKAEERQRAKYPNGRVKVFAGEVLLSDKPYSYRHKKPPYVILYDYLIPHEWIGMGEGDQMEELNISLNFVLQLLDKWITNYCDPPWLADVNAGFNMETLKEEIKKGGAVFEVDMRAVDEPLKKVRTNEPANVLGDFIGVLMKMMEHITGATDITKGLTTKVQEQSATEISTLMESAYTRTRQRVRNLEAFIKRLLYLMLEIQQQFYMEVRQFSRRDEDSVEWFQVSNNRQFAGSTVRSPQPEMLTEEEKQQEDDHYRQFIEAYGDVDEVYAEFDLEVQTNSTLPMDRQSLANLFLRLLQQAQGSPVTALPMWEATLERLQVPKWKEIVDKMKKMMEAEKQGAQQ